MPNPATRGTITVLAGVNGAGKSSVVGSFIRQGGGDYYNPDEATRDLLLKNPGLAPVTANGLAWSVGKERLEHAISEGTDFVFETTLGANTITQLLLRATREGRAVKVCFVGLASVQHHLRRVAARVAAGGHDGFGPFGRGGEVFRSGDFAGYEMQQEHGRRGRGGAACFG